MYVDEIRAYTPQNEQEAADQRLILEYIRLFPDNILTRDNEIAHLSSSGFVVNADGTRVLMAHHNIYRVWAWTGGHADGEGDLLSVALREAREETGVEPVSYTHLDVYKRQLQTCHRHVCSRCGFVFMSS